MLHFETGWSKLEDRRKSRKLNLFDKIENNMAPTYLSDCLPTTIGETVTYNPLQSLLLQVANILIFWYHDNNSHPTVHKHTPI
jgi:hypothetical protein